MNPVDTDLSDALAIQNDLTQGDALAPVLFNLPYNSVSNV
jgi:hypothetical protein